MLSGADAAPIEGGSAEEKAAGQTWSFTPDPQLPNVLILGDSISIGYTLLVRKRLAGVANVFRPLDASGKQPFNCGDSARGLTKLDTWIRGHTWRVIHLNFGLHDLKYLDAKGKYVAPELGKQVAPPDAYEANLRTMIARLKPTGATLVWATTTPVPTATLGRVAGDEIPYNARATKVMKENGVLIDDLCAALGDRLASLQRPHNVHFTDQGSNVLADAVAASITTALASHSSTPSPNPVSK